MKFAYTIGDDLKDFLTNIAGVGFLKAGPAAPRVDYGSVQPSDALPRIRVLVDGSNQQTL